MTNFTFTLLESNTIMFLHAMSFLNTSPVYYTKCILTIKYRRCKLTESRDSKTLQGACVGPGQQDVTSGNAAQHAESVSLASW